MNLIEPESEQQPLLGPKPSTMTAPSHSPQLAQNRLAREQAVQQQSPAINQAAPGVEFNSQGRLLILGAEHRVRLAASRLTDLTSITALITQAMPEQLTAEMEAAAVLVPSLNLYRVSLTGLTGYLGQFKALVEIDGQPQSLAQLVRGPQGPQGTNGFDLVLDLGCPPQLAMDLKPAGYFSPAGDAEFEAALAELPTMQGGFEKPRYVQINTDLCAHSGSGITGCRRCLDVCPADAISVAAARVQIDSHLCHGAGGCASACPTSAIRYGYPQPGQLLDNLQRLLASYRLAGGEAPWVLLHDATCAEQQLAGLLEALPGHYLPLQIEEMGSAGMEVWLSAIALGAVGVALLVEDPLPESVQRVLDSEIETSNRLLQGLGVASRVALVDSQQLLNPAKTESAISTISTTSAINTANTTRPIAAIAQLDLQADKRQQISQAMSHLYQQVIEQTELPAEIVLDKGAAFGSLALATRECTLCMSCVSICPSKALSSTPDTPRLSFTEDACVQCGLCTQACPESALALQPRYLLQPEQRTQPRVLKQEQPFCCICCDKPFATQSVVSLMLKKLAGHSMFDAAGLRRLEMCEDCRVIDIVKTDPGGDLFAHAKGRPADSVDLNLARVETAASSDASAGQNRIDAVEVTT
ncbi:MAG: 4Fe-4S binding protein [Motiliproteus sp.]